LKPVAVVGASGFIGSRLVEMLHLEALADTRPIVRRRAGLARSARFALHGRVADAFDASALRSAFEGCDVVVHAIAGNRRTIVGTLEPSYRAAQEAGVRRLVYLSSASVHGQAPAPGTDETSRLSSRQPIPYNNSKVAAERRLRRLRQTGNVELVILRPGIVFGPRSAWTGGLADELLTGTAYLVDGGEGICNSIYVDNLVRAIHLASTVPGIDGHAFLLGDRETVTWSDLYLPVVEALGMRLADVPVINFQRLPAFRISSQMRTAARILPHPLRRRIQALRAGPHRVPISSRPPWSTPAKPKPTATEERALLHRCRYKLPSRKAEAMLGYEPEISFAEGCRRSVGWLAFAGYPVVTARTSAFREAEA
jgi:nucleoside-diphosphate-sugar epimerase